MPIKDAIFRTPQGAAEWRVGIDEPLPFGAIVGLAQTLSGQAENWQEVFDRMDQQYHRFVNIGPQRMEELQRYRQWVESQREVGPTRPMHVIEFLGQSGARKRGKHDLLRQPIALDGTPYAAIRRETNKVLNALLQRKSVRLVDRQHSGSLSEIRSEIAFFNSYFDTDLELSMSVVEKQGVTVKLVSGEGRTVFAENPHMLDVYVPKL